MFGSGTSGAPDPYYAAETNIAPEGKSFRDPATNSISLHTISSDEKPSSILPFKSELDSIMMTDSSSNSAQQAVFFCVLDFVWCLVEANREYFLQLRSLRPNRNLTKDARLEYREIASFTFRT